MTEKHTFFVPPSGFSGDRVAFPEAEARHAARVLRIAPGNDVHVVDGEGGRYRVRIDSVGRHAVSGTVTGRQEGEPPIRPELTLAVGLLKNSGRFETVLEKAAELGVARIIPLVAGRTETGRLRADRASGILVAAMKQCGRARLVALDPPMPLADVLAAARQDLRVICHEGARPADRLAAILADGPPARSACVLVGSEGGFTDQEIDAARSAGFRTASLGPTRLRTETAALAASALVLLGSRESPDNP
jgi:16S rRNA (uracil1498-N3)-methyltransferase